MGFDWGSAIGGAFGGPLGAAGAISNIFGGSKTPNVPDYKGAAEATAAGNLANTTAQTWANRPNINTPGGSMSWSPTQSIDPATGKPVTSWAMNVNLSPEQQGIYNSQQNIQAGRMSAAEGMLPAASAALQKGINWDAFGTLGNGDQARNQAITGAYNQATSRLDPQWAQQESNTRSRLAGMGLDMGSAAYDRELGNFDRSRNDAYSSAMNGAIAQGTAAGNSAFQNNLAARQQGIGEAYQQQYGGMNALNAMSNGQQVSMPSFPGFSQAGQAQAPNYLGAAQMQGQGNLDIYNSQQMQQQGAMSGLGSLASFIPFML